jgi:hypothetical protein
MSSAIQKELKFQEVKRYCNYSSNQPWIAEIFCLGMTRKDKVGLFVMTVLNKEMMSHNVYSPNLSLFISRIDDEPGFFGESLWEMFSDSNSTIHQVEDGIFAGEIKELSKKFHLAQFDLELFNNKNPDEVIKASVLPKIKRILSL